MTELLDPVREIADQTAGTVGVDLTEDDMLQVSRDPATVLAAGAVIVALAQLGWAVYSDLSSRKEASPTAAELDSAMDEQLGDRTEDVEEIYKVVVETTVRVGKTRISR